MAVHRKSLAWLVPSRRRLGIIDPDKACKLQLPRQERSRPRSCCGARFAAVRYYMPLHIDHQNNLKLRLAVRQLPYIYPI